MIQSYFLTHAFGKSHLICRFDCCWAVHNSGWWAKKVALLCVCAKVMRWVLAVSPAVSPAPLSLSFTQIPSIWITILVLDYRGKVSASCLLTWAISCSLNACNWTLTISLIVTNFIMKAFINGRRVFGIPVKGFPKDNPSKLVSFW